MEGYKFTKEGLEKAVKDLNEYHGLPVKGGVTKFSEESFTKLNENEYFIAYDKDWTSILGEPIEVEINEN
jgi:hypothetical protein